MHFMAGRLYGAAFLAGALSLSSNLIAQTPASRVIGRITDFQSGEPIGGASVVLGSAVYATDRKGTFVSAPLPPGVYRLRVEMIGYLTRADSIEVQPERTHDVEVRLTRQPVELPPLVVSTRSRWLEVNGVYDRRYSGYNVKLITAADIEKRQRTSLTDALIDIQGSKIVTSRRGRKVFRLNREVSDAGQPALMSRGRLPGCEPALFIDGRRYQDRLTGSPEGLTIDDWDVITTLAVEAIEVYTHGTPVEYSHPCGVVLIWTRRGG
jgi:hypothetical protein